MSRRRRAHGRTRGPRWTSNQRATLVAMSIANFAVALDFLGVNVALPAIGRDLGGALGGLQWVTTAYLLTLTTVLIPAGRAADLFGRTRTCIAGLTVFAAGSVVSALSGTIDLLVVARGVTGAGAAILTATTLAIVSDAFPDHSARGPAIGAWTAIGAVGSALGPPVAGVVTEVASWRWFLVVAVPLTATALLFLVRRDLRDPGPSPAGRAGASGRSDAMDWTGAALMTLGVGALVVVLLEGPDLGWNAPLVVGAAVGAVVGLGLFVARERTAPTPLIDLGSFRDRRFVTSSGVAFIANIAFACVMFFMTLYLQSVRGLTSSEAGLVFLGLSAALVVGSPIAGRLVVRVGGATVMAAGMILIAASFVVLGLVGVGTGVAIIVGGLALSGLGQAFAFDASNTTALDAVDDAAAGAAAGLVSGARQAGSLFGLAVAGSAFRLLERNAESVTGTRQAFLDALEPTMLGVAACCAVGVVIAMLGRAHPAARRARLG
ncbi:MAG: MFS transporter [Acidimicrobiia bacterium]